ncbi:MAG: nitrite/sulfite reductase [Myxococcales bacterium]|nr:nitrite/sulfite reductase [Myxococcales bacterium]
MYQYDQYDQAMVQERARQFRGQVERRMKGELSEEEFLPLRLQNGLYLQLHAYMMRVAIPYGLLSSAQLRRLAAIARKYDRGYGHFTTRQNIQYNWLALPDVPSILDDLAEVEMHAIQTSGNCIRNITSDPYAGVARDEIEDPRPYCEILRQWSTFHPEFAYLPRKFKIAVTGARTDRAAIAFHDIGIRIVENGSGEHGFEFIAGGGQGRTPVVGPVIHPFVAKEHLLSYTEAILRVYNRQGRRDNKFKARIKILVKAMGTEAFAEAVRVEWEKIRDTPSLRLDDAEIERMKRFFVPPNYAAPQGGASLAGVRLSKDRDFARWAEHNVEEHRVPGYTIVPLSLKRPDLPPGDVTDTQMEAVADIADRYSLGRIVVTHRQNLVLTDVKEEDLPSLYGELRELGLASPNYNTITDVIACPGLDYCDLANARSISVARAVMDRFQDLGKIYELGEITLNISGCINACGHHHVGHIGILGIDKQGVEHYQLMVGGSASDDASIGKILGPAFKHDEIADAVERLVTAFLELRTSPEERFLDAFRRLGPAPFKERVYASH